MTDIRIELTAKEASLFNDPAIEAAYQAWVNSHNDTETNRQRGYPLTRKQFLMRVRALIQSGRI
jgi:hypothetical protein